MARDRLPAEVRAQIGRAKVLGWGRWQGSRDELGYAVASMSGLHLFRSQDSPVTTITWDSIVRAQWNDPVLEVVHQPEAGRPPVERSLTLPAPGQVPDAVRDRVTSNIFVSTHVKLDGDRGARLIARRRTDGPGMDWTVVFDSGLDSEDPRLRAAADRALAEVRAQFGV